MLLKEIQHPAIEIDLAYAGDNNLTGIRLYENAIATLHPDAANALYVAAELAIAQGYRLRVLDAFRPASVQRKLWQALPNPEFVADPTIGSDHTRGIAVDLTLIDGDGRPLDMATQFDAAVPQSHHGRTDIPAICVRNRHLLMGTMVCAGFRHNPFEWWHYSLPNPGAYPLLDDDLMGR